MSKQEKKNTEDISDFDLPDGLSISDEKINGLKNLDGQSKSFVSNSEGQEIKSLVDDNEAFGVSTSPNPETLEDKFKFDEILTEKKEPPVNQKPEVSNSKPKVSDLKPETKSLKPEALKNKDENKKDTNFVTIKKSVLKLKPEAKPNPQPIKLETKPTPQHTTSELKKPEPEIKPKPNPQPIKLETKPKEEVLLNRKPEKNQKLPPDPTPSLKKPENIDLVRHKVKENERNLAYNDGLKENSKILKYVLEKAGSILKNKILFKINDKKLVPLHWDKFLTPKSETTEISLETPSIFRIAFRSKDKYFGEVYKSEVNDIFFENWMGGQYPKNMVVLCLADSLNAFGFLAGVCIDQGITCDKLNEIKRDITSDFLSNTNNLANIEKKAA